MNAKDEPLIAPRVTPALDPAFRPAVLANRAFGTRVKASGHPQSVRLALEQADGSVFHYATEIFAESDARAAGNFNHVERLVKFLLWGWGGWRIHVDGPSSLAEK